MTKKEWNSLIPGDVITCRGAPEAEYTVTGSGAGSGGSEYECHVHWTDGSPDKEAVRVHHNPGLWTIKRRAVRPIARLDLIDDT